MKPKLIRTSTVSGSLRAFLDGTIEVLMEKFDLILVSSPGEDLAYLNTRFGVKTEAIPMERRIAPFKDLSSLCQLVKCFRREKPFIVHSMTPKAGLLCMMAAWIARVPRRVHTFTGLVWPTSSGVMRKLLMCTDWLTCSFATHIIPEGFGVMNDLQNHITKKPMRVLGYGNVRGVNLDYWSRANIEYELYSQIRDEHKFTFLFVGRIVRDKGINELVEAFMRIREQYSSRLVLVGKFEDSIDPISEETRFQIQKCPDILYAGVQRGKNLITYYAVADCFAFPSYREGFPNTVLEAGALGLPSIVTDINGSREIIEDGKNGLIIPSKDVDSLEKAMIRMITDDEIRIPMAACAREMISSRFDQTFVRQCLMDFYSEL